MEFWIIFFGWDSFQCYILCYVLVDMATKIRMILQVQNQIKKEFLQISFVK